MVEQEDEPVLDGICNPILNNPALQLNGHFQHHQIHDHAA